MFRLDRRELLASTLAFALASAAHAQSRTPRILLVCQFGSVKSATARELLKRAAAQRGVRVSVASRGITPAEHMSPELKQRLAADGIDPAAEPLRQLKPADVAAADMVIAFDTLPASYHPRRFVDWRDLPSMLNDYDHARHVLDARISALLDQLRSGR